MQAGSWGIHPVAHPNLIFLSPVAQRPLLPLCGHPDGRRAEPGRAHQPLDQRGEAMGAAVPSPVELGQAPC